ncbi:unnamed protein product [Acanthoscelides obtectus]|uniref:Uncharacterized protein n=1 Tax=Acanthoscelides obtectus TaxID=200917 RepID=A0A9P0KA34_ACAOB|nr:unnamed protein product [Acanthoscelides obtectus]CAK1677901.1 hypothetical protein AOBTE_LOCUS31632 [Acanthoscelides obtectus]
MLTNKMKLTTLTKD